MRLYGKVESLFWRKRLRNALIRRCRELAPIFAPSLNEVYGAKPSSAQRKRYALLKDVWDLTGGRCAYCAEKVTFSFDFHIDHVHPRKLGGEDVIGNFLPACHSCNSRKGARLFCGFARAILLGGANA